MPIDKAHDMLHMLMSARCICTRAYDAHDAC